MQYKLMKWKWQAYLCRRHCFDGKQQKRYVFQMLQIADTFANIWGLTFNDNKCEVMVIGQNYLADIKWLLWCKMLPEPQIYKYLCVIINRHLMDTDHLHGHLAEKFNKLESYIRYTLANNLDIKRVTLGNTLWQNPVWLAMAQVRLHYDRKLYCQPWPMWGYIMTESCIASPGPCGGTLWQNTVLPALAHMGVHYDRKLYGQPWPKWGWIHYGRKLYCRPWPMWWYTMAE